MNGQLFRSFQGGYPRWVALFSAVFVMFVSCGGGLAAADSMGEPALAVVPAVFGVVVARRFVWTFLCARVDLDAEWVTIVNFKSTTRVRVDGAGVFVSPYGALLPRSSPNLGRAGFVDQEGCVHLSSGVGVGHLAWRRRSAGWDLLAAAVAAGAVEVEPPYWIPFVGWRTAE
ncbi:MAG: hypothetical protein O3C27_02050 [Actinomycetota bacterium]|nr:hypothetical protein [Actinomycetota bacterium]